MISKIKNLKITYEFSMKTRVTKNEYEKIGTSMHEIEK